MKKLYLLLTGVALAGMLVVQCADPLNDVDLQVSTEVIHYTTMLQIEDGNGGSLSGLNVTISGADAAYIYNLAGRREFAIQGGFLGLGVHPDHEPTEDQPVKFLVELSGEGFITQKIPVTLTSEQLQSRVPVNVLKVSNAPAGVVISAPSVGLSGNSIGTTTTISTPLENGAAQSVEITLEAGTKFLDASGNAVSGSALTTTIVNADPSKESALAVFPGGKLSTDNVVAEGSSQSASGAFNPAGLVSIEFSVGNESIRNFSQPIKLTMELDPAFVNLNTGADLEAGDQLGIYSYQTETAQWRFESNGSVQIVNGKPVLEFETDHLTWYMAGNFVSSCTQALTLNLNGSWMQAGISYPLTVEAVLGGKVIAKSEVSVSNTDNVVQLNDIPASGLNIRVKTSGGEVIANTPVNSSCGSGATSVTLSEPAENEPVVTLQLYVRCPGQSQTVTVLPTFYLYYREAAPSSDASGFKLLGVVERGFLSTTLLTANSVEYDFKAVWGDEVKVVNRKTVSVDNSGTVGAEAGDIIGEKVGAENLQILTEKCNELL